MSDWIQKGASERFYITPVHDLISCLTAGWRRYAVVNRSLSMPTRHVSDSDLTRVPDNVLFGVPVFTAYYGLKDIWQFKEGESLIVMRLRDLIDATPDVVDAYFDKWWRDVGKPTTGATWTEVFANRLTIQGFIILDFMFPKDGSDRVATEAFLKIAGALQRGDITLKKAEDIVEAPFIDTPNVWERLFTGANTGKLVTKLNFSA
ncbi:hypothetical protein DEU56DRAFT_904930 [Suillus clintonianus]|uniref:uncharacterized protein n=1 Tax=Suillus clintonianus TaxID=1904413 RepID=UPI001B8612EF|nr:uncharacterized protein DEU56DRAFT_904930 [Suillus clintonianus]KAG2119204.1 hypothetical protein DEU56DRAFT_904930 [Suillus clintonianus]